MKKFLSYLGSLFWLIVLAESCTTASSVDKNIDIKEVASFNQLSDSSFFAQVFDIKFFEGNYLIAEYKTNMVYQCTANFGLVKKFGGLGKGPSDLLMPAQIYPTSNYYYIFEEMNQRITIVDRNFKFSSIVNNDFSGDMMTKSYIDDSSNLFCGVRGKDAPLLKFNLKSGIKIQFGTYKPSKSLLEQFANNQYHIIPSGDYILAIARSDPRIEIFNKYTLQKLGTFSYEDLAIARSRMDFAKSEMQMDSKNSECTYILVQDVCLFKDKLFLLLVDNLDVAATLNKVVCFDIKNLSLEYERTYCFSNKDKTIKWFTCFTINDNNQIVAFSPQTTAFYTFKL